MTELRDYEYILADVDKQSVIGFAHRKIKAEELKEMSGGTGNLVIYRKDDDSTVELRPDFVPCPICKKPVHKNNDLQKDNKAHCYNCYHKLCHRCLHLDATHGLYCKKCKEIKKMEMEERK